MPKGKRTVRKAEVRRKREFTLRGMTLPELQALPLAELAKVLPARPAGRSSADSTPSSSVSSTD